MNAAIADREAAPGPTQPLDVDDDDHRRRARPRTATAPRWRTATRYDCPPWRSSTSRPISVSSLRAPTARPAEERGAIERGLELAGIDRGGDEGHVGEPRRAGARRSP